MSRAAAFAALLLTLTAAPSARADLALVHVAVVDGRGGMPVADRTVIVRGDRIVAVGPASTLQPPRGVKRIDGRGAYVMPGLIDAHIHLIGAGQWRGLANPPGTRIDFAAARAYLQGYLYEGVTSVYDAGNDPELILALRSQERAGTLTSPRIFATGHAISYPGSWMAGSFHGVGAPDWPDTIGLLQQQLAAQPDMQKLVMERFAAGPNSPSPFLPPELMGRIVAWMHEHGVRTTVHATTEEFARAAVDAGIDTLAHPVGAAPISDDFVRQLAQRGIPIATTLSVYDEIIRLGTDPSYLDDPLFTDVLEPAEIAARKAEGPRRYGALGWVTRFQALNPVLRGNVRKLYDAGAVLVLATDRSEGPMLHREMELLASLGIPAADVVRIGTLNGARFLGREADLGTIEAGKLADLVLLDADPTRDVRNVRRIRAVIKAGQVVDRGALDLPVNRRRSGSVARGS